MLRNLGQQVFQVFVDLQLVGFCGFHQAVDHSTGLGAVDSVNDVPVGTTGQVLVRVQAIFNGGLDQAEHDGAAGSTLGGVGEQEVFSVNDKGIDTSLSTVIGNCVRCSGRVKLT